MKALLPCILFILLIACSKNKNDSSQTASDDTSKIGTTPRFPDSVHYLGTAHFVYASTSSGGGLNIDTNYDDECLVVYTDSNTVHFKFAYTVYSAPGYYIYAQDFSSPIRKDSTYDNSVHGHTATYQLHGDSIFINQRDYKLGTEEDRYVAFRGKKK